MPRLHEPEQISETELKRVPLLFRSYILRVSLHLDNQSYLKLSNICRASV